MYGNIQHLNPEGLSKNPAFSQLVTTQGSGTTIYVGGQDAVNPAGEIVGKGDIEAQTKQVMENLLTALSACGANLDHVVKMNIYLVQGQDLSVAFRAAQPFMSALVHPPAVSGMFVAALANPDFLVEVDAIAFLPEKSKTK